MTLCYVEIDFDLLLDLNQDNICKAIRYCVGKYARQVASGVWCLVCLMSGMCFIVDESLQLLCLCCHPHHIRHMPPHHSQSVQLIHYIAVILVIIDNCSFVSSVIVNYWINFTKSAARYVM